MNAARAERAGAGRFCCRAPVAARPAPPRRSSLSRRRKTLVGRGPRVGEGTSRGGAKSVLAAGPMANRGAGSAGIDRSSSRIGRVSGPGVDWGPTASRRGARGESAVVGATPLGGSEKSRLLRRVVAPTAARGGTGLPVRRPTPDSGNRQRGAERARSHGPSLT